MILIIKSDYNSKAMNLELYMLKYNYKMQKEIVMSNEISLSLIQSVVDSQKDLIVIFHDNREILINKAFKKFVGVSSLEQYREDFGPFINNFVPHPSYFNADFIESDESWFDAILRKPKLEQMVSMMNSTSDPHAFAVEIDTNTPEYTIVNFNDITQTLIKRIMIENERNIDKKSGAYAKDYFLQVAQSYQEAAVFNEKIICTIFININVSQENSEGEFVEFLKASTRQDDMIVRWGSDKFLIVFLSDSELNAILMLKKLEEIMEKKGDKSLSYDLSLHTQVEGESIDSVIKKAAS